MSAEDELQAIYDSLPKVLCKGLCADSCTSISATPLERRRVAERGVVLPPSIPHRQHLREIEQGVHRTCPALSAIGTCRVYNVRPFVCRIFGAVQGSLCEHGCVPDRVLTLPEAFALQRAIERLEEARSGQRNKY